MHAPTFRTLRLAALAALLPIAAACSDDDASGPRQPELGAYRMSLAGDHQASHDGEAVFGVDGEEGEEYFGVLLGTDEQDLANLIFLRPGTTRLPVGRHDVANTTDTQADDPADVEVLLGIGNQGSSTVGFLDGESGSITVTKSSPTELAGTFSIVTKGLLQKNGGVAQPATVRVSGAFTARAVGAASLRGVRVQRLN